MFDSGRLAEFGLASSKYCAETNANICYRVEYQRYQYCSDRHKYKDAKHQYEQHDYAYDAHIFLIQHTSYYARYNENRVVRNSVDTDE